MITDSLGRNWYKVGLHIHTNLSDGALSPKEAALRYKKAGFDAIAITDHWKYGAEAELEGLKIISGCEYNLGASDTVSGVMHIVGIGMKYEPEFNIGCSRQQVIDGINNAGGMAVFAHPAWSLNTVAEAMALNGFGALEIYNTVSGVHESDRPYSGYIADLLSNEGVFYPLIATDDVHYYDGTDDTISFIMVNAEKDSTESILKAIRDCKFYSTQGPELYVEKMDNKVIVKCSECAKISFFSNYAWAPDRVKRGEDLTYAEYSVKKDERWVRVETCDKNGRFAWSNIIVFTN